MIFDPDQLGTSGFGYMDSTDVVTVNGAGAGDGDSIPFFPQTFTPQITLNLRAASSEFLPALDPWGLLVLALGLSAAGVAATVRLRHPR